MLLADEARFRAKQGLFQSIGLYSIFGKKLVEHLWLLWELVLTGGPTLVLGSSVGASSAAILGMVSFFFLKRTVLMLVIMSVHFGPSPVFVLCLKGAGSVCVLLCSIMSDVAGRGVG